MTKYIKTPKLKLVTRPDGTQTLEKTRPIRIFGGKRLRFVYIPSHWVDFFKVGLWYEVKNQTRTNRRFIGQLWQNKITKAKFTKCR